MLTGPSNAPRHGPTTESGPGLRSDAGRLRVRWAQVVRCSPGLALALGIAGVAMFVGSFVPLVGAPVTGVVIGVGLAAVRKPGARAAPGIGLASRRVLQVAVVVLGAQLSLAQLVKVGIGTLPVMIGTVTVCLLLAYFVGRWLRVSGELRTLIGVGTGICGASAIAAVTPVIGAASLDVAFAVSTIFLFNIAAVLSFPLLGHLLGLSQHSFGLFAGTAVNDVSSVVATSTTYGASAGSYAVVVKLTRTLLIIPVCLGLAALTARRARSGTRTVADPARGDNADPAAPLTATRPRLKLHRLVPWFLVGFVLIAAANSIGLIPAATHHGLAQVSAFLVTVALSAIGLSTDLAGFRCTGARPLLLGALLWMAVSGTSLALQAVTGTI
jgi:uncharacterized integral membrane protein (TIGR00698 family)